MRFSYNFLKLQNYIMFLIAVAAVLCSASLANGFAITNCGGSLGTLHYVIITGCDQTADTCVMRRGYNITIVVDATINENASSLTASAKFYNGWIISTVALANSEICNDPNSGITCPVVNGQNLHYTGSAPVLNSYPPVSGTLQLKVLDQSSNTVGCFSFPCKIQ